MNAPQKFLFNTSFELEDDAAPLPAGDEPARPEACLTVEDLERAREEGFARGREAGLEAAGTAREAELERSLAALQARLADLAERSEAMAAVNSQEILHLTVAMLRRLFPRLTAAHGVAEIEAVIRDCLHRVRDEPRLVVRVADSLLDEIERRVGVLASRSGFEGRIVFLSQDDLRPGDVLVEWADGGAERNGGAVWREIESVLSRVLVAGEEPAADRPASGVAIREPEAEAVVSA